MNSDGLYGPLKILFFFESSPPRSWVIRLTGNIFVSLRNPSLGFIPSMEKQSTQPICGQEALQLLNCVAESPFDQEKCVRFLQSLRECVLSKKVKKFSIPSQDHDSEGAASATKRPS